LTKFDPVHTQKKSAGKIFRWQFPAAVAVGGQWRKDKENRKLQQ